MKTAVTKTSIDSYNGQNFDTERDRVFNAIWFLREACIADIAKFTGIDKSAVSGRLNELKKGDNPKVEHAGKKKSKATGIMADHWRVKETLF